MFKKKGYYLILLLSLISIALIGYSLFVENSKKPHDDYLFTVSIRIENQEITIYPYQKENNYYFFLPPYAQNKDTYIIKNKKHDISLNDIELASKNEISNFDENIMYKITDNNENVGTLSIMYGSEIPTLYIETNSRNIDELKNNIYKKDSASLFVIDNGSVNYKNSIEFITGRGNHSWSLAKKGWSLKLFEDASLLNMKKDDQWVLTSNMFDDTLGLRNYVAYNMASALELEGTSDFRFVDVYIDNLYQGTYILFEKIGQSKEKLDIGDLDLLNDKSNKTIELNKLKLSQTFNILPDYPDESYREFNSPENISGGYIIERNIIYKTADKEHLFTTSNGETFVIRYPSYVNKEELDYIKNIVECVERAIHADDFIDPETHKSLDELIDIDSFVLKYLVDEVTKNEGAAATSAYYYKKQNDDKLYAGPVWDYDKSLGRVSKWVSPEGLSNGMLYTTGTPSDWYQRLYDNPEVNILIKKYYKEKIKPYLSSIKESLIDEQAEIIKDSFIMNNIVWGEEFYKEEYRLPSDLIERVGDLDYSIDYLKKWLKDREEFLDREWSINDEN